MSFLTQEDGLICSSLKTIYVIYSVFSEAGLSPTISLQDVAEITSCLAGPQLDQECS